MEGMAGGQINSVTCLLNFPIFPWGEDEVEGPSGHLPQGSCQLQFVSSLVEESSFSSIPSGRGGAWKCQLPEELNVMQHIPEF